MYNKFIHLLWWLYLLQKSIWGHIYMWRKKNQNKQQGSQRIVSLHSLFPFASGTARIMQNTAKSMTSLTRTSLPSGETEALWLAWSFSTSLYTRSWFSASLHDRTLQAGHFYIKMGLRVWVFFFPCHGWMVEAPMEASIHQRPCRSFRQESCLSGEERHTVNMAGHASPHTPE